MEADTILYKEKCSKLNDLMDRLTKKDTALAFSGGVDSSLLLQAAVKAAEKNGTRVIAITADTELHPTGDLTIAKNVAETIGAEHHIIHLSEFDHEEIRKNPVDRCYLCKKILFSEMQKKAESLGVFCLMEGTNTDDLKVYRPGLKAIKELGVLSPMAEAGFTKADVRRLAGEYGIAVADRPSVPCLATRFPYGTWLMPEELKKVEQGEAILREYNLYNIRLRVHGECARIEVDPEAIPVIIENRLEITEKLQNLGYSYVSLDLAGFRSGSMDEKLPEAQKQKRKAE